MSPSIVLGLKLVVTSLVVTIIAANVLMYLNGDSNNIIGLFVETYKHITK